MSETPPPPPPGSSDDQPTTPPPPPPGSSSEPPAAPPATPAEPTQPVGGSAPPPPSYDAPPPSYDAPPPSYDQAQPPAYGQQQYAAPQPWAGQPGQMTPDERTWGGAAHWSALVASLVGLAFLGPLLIMLIKGNESAYIRQQAVESLNFQLTTLIAFIVAFLLIFVLVGFLLLPLVGIWWLVFTIIGSIKASNGELYRYPATIRMVS